MKDDFQIVLVNIINLFKFNSIESIIKFILFVFLIVVASIVIHLVCKFISLSIKKKETENKNDQDIKNIKKKPEYYEGYIQGAIDRKTEECNSDVIFNRINQATGNTIAPINKTSNGNSNYSLTGTNGPKPVIPTLPTNESLADNRLAYLKGYIDGHKDDKFWDKQEIWSKLNKCEYRQKG